MPTVSGSRAARAHAKLTDNRRTKSERGDQLQLLGKVIRELSGPKLRNSELSMDLETWQAMRTPDDRVIPRFTIGGDEDRALNLPFTGCSVDVEKGEFYVNRWGDDHGPFKLPDGFVFENLFPNTERSPAARSVGHKALKGLSKAILDQEPEVYGKPWVNVDYDSAGGTWRTEAGDKLHNPSPNDERFPNGTRSFMIDLKHRHFYLEQIPGVSGQCMGPFKLPDGFQLKDVKALGKLNFSDVPSSTSTRDSFDSSSRSSDSSSDPSSWSVGGGGSGAAPAVGGGGSGGSVRSFYYGSRGGGGGGS